MDPPPIPFLFLNQLKGCILTLSHLVHVELSAMVWVKCTMHVLGRMAQKAEKD